MSCALPRVIHAAPNPGRRLTVIARRPAIAFLPDLDPGDVPQKHGRAVGIDAQKNAFEFTDRGKLRLCGQRDRQTLPFGRRLSAKRADGHIAVLFGHGCGDVGGVIFIGSSQIRIA